MAKPRLGCIGCEHLELYLGSHGYSEYTPGGPGYFSCNKGVWSEEDEGSIHAKMLYEIVSIGSDCKKFEWSADLED